MTTSATPKIGDAVLCDGELCLMTDLRTRYSSSTGEPVQAAQYESPRFRHYGLVRELAWDATLSAWYLWGRCLSPEQTGVVITLRDRGHLPARGTRQPGSAPAGGEHLNLYLSLFHGRPSRFWDAAIAAAVVGQPLGTDAEAAIASYRQRFAQPLARGYADPDADDSTGEG